jgi:hypothetical protein
MRGYSTRIVFDIATSEILERDQCPYEGAWELCCGGGATSQETSLQAQSAAEATQLQTDFNNQFADQQGLLKSFLIPQLEGMITNPPGFGATALADLNAQLVNNVAGQTANLRQEAQQNFGTNNMAGLPSGVQAVANAELGAQSAGAIEQGSSNIGLQNAQLQAQQRLFGLSGLQTAESALGAAPQTGSLMLRANQNSFNQASTIQQQNAAAGSWWKPIVGGLIGAGAGILTGGLSNLTSGLGFMGGGGGGGGGAMTGEWATADSSPAGGGGGGFPTGGF